MNELFEKAFAAYTQMLKIHINTKTMDRDFHEATEVFYEALFTCAHKIWEKHVDLGGRLSGENLAEEKALALKTLEDFRKELEAYSKSWDISLGTEDLLGSLANDIEFNIGTAKWYTG